MKRGNLTRRTFLATASAGTVAAVAAGGNSALGNRTTNARVPALLGGQPVRKAPWPKWPIWVKEDEDLILSVLRSGVWSRAGVVKEFEAKYAELMGTKRCLATTNGTNALLTSLEALKIGAGDEVLVSSYTWIATIDVILLTKAMPIFVDTDPITFQLNPDKIEERITSNTRAILPVHIYGLPADMYRVNAIAEKHDLFVVEDACQAWMAELDHKKVGTFGNLGCFSFQNSKHLTCGEGGAVIGDDEALMDRCYSYHNFGRPCGSVQGNGFVIAANKCRMAEFQAAMLLGQMKRLEEQTTTRNENAEYLTSRIKDIPGIIPHELYPEATRAAYHLYPFRYKKDVFKGLSRKGFLRALAAEGIPASEGYRPMQGMDFLEDAFKSKAFQKIYSKKMLDIDRYREENDCPDNKRLCDEAIVLSQRLFLGTKKDVDDIADAILKIYENRDKLV